ncbi:MAG: hypothetical protein QOH36_426 [Actinomycetota bacterium]|nr:hypothetical protein [Actinomycetota bacterium]
MDVVRSLVSAVDALCAADPSTLADGESLVALQRELERLQAVVTRATAAFDAGGSWAADGARSSAAWLTARCGLPVATARRRVRLGRDLRHMAKVEAAWLTGAIGEAQVAQLAEARTEVTAESFARDEEMLVDHAKQLPYRQFTRALAYWSQHADPDGVEDAAAAQHRARRLHLSCGFDGAWFLDGVLDPISGEIVSRALRAIEEELFAADWAEARARVGEGLCSTDLARSPAQRRADALVEMARRAMALPPGARLPEPLFTVLVGYETFAGRMCELASGRDVTPGSLVPWLDEAWAERVVFDGPDRVKNVSVRRRIFAGATRRAVEVRDRECFHPLCDATVEDCQVDHVQPWSVGGLTVDTNGRLACAFHNRLRHRPRPPPPP